MTCIPPTDISNKNTETNVMETSPNIMIKNKNITKNPKNTQKRITEQTHPDDTNIRAPLTSAQHKSTTATMNPTNLAKSHPAYPILLHYAQNGCPIDCGPPWSHEHITAAVHQGNHPSTCTPEAIACLRAETLKKVEASLARLVLWDDLKDNIPSNLKISPLAAIPHKSRPF